MLLNKYYASFTFLRTKNFRVYHDPTIIRALIIGSACTNNVAPNLFLARPSVSSLLAHRQGNLTIAKLRNPRFMNMFAFQSASIAGKNDNIKRLHDRVVIMFSLLVTINVS